MAGKEQEKKSLTEYEKNPIVLPHLFERLEKADNLIWFSTYNKSKTSESDLELIELLIAPKEISYDPEELQKKLDTIVYGLNPVWVSNPEVIPILGLRIGGVQFKEMLVDGERPSIRYTTVKVYPNSHLAELMADYNQKVLKNIWPHISSVATLRQWIDPHLAKASLKGHELKNWFHEQLERVLTKDETSHSKS